MQYVGRFAPSPTGPLHAGSLVAALASYLDARVHGGQWLLRLDDADLSRVQAQAAQTITAQLAHYGFQWHGAVAHTQTFRPQHATALSTLGKQGLCYACACSRAKLAGTPPNALGERVYPRICRNQTLAPDCVRAVRLACPEQIIELKDRWAGVQQQNVARDVGDFVLWRPESVTHFAGGLYNYQLTMVVDDAAQGVTHVVRGADLLGNTPRQCLLYDALGLQRPSYLHVPVVMMESGLKLSKQHGAPALPFLDPMPLLDAALVHLGCTATHAGHKQAFWAAAAKQWENRLSQLKQ